MASGQKLEASFNASTLHLSKNHMQKSWIKNSIKQVIKTNMVKYRIQSEASTKITLYSKGLRWDYRWSLEELLYIFEESEQFDETWNIQDDTSSTMPTYKYYDQGYILS